ncbi:LysR family transcriptional regulator [Alkanindiges sp. WGS2144]|uniref:LysR family transcriptional regulator n=1 Tax=Alkanindiges sp. WGS2144 TaxID=3366808 RepID=UPI0037534B59
MHKTHDSRLISRMDLNLFRVFAAIYREANLTRAAEQLFLSQSAVSHALARMREQLNDPLFVREGQGVCPTPLAQRLWPDIEHALSLLQQAMQRASTFEPNRDLRQLTLAMNDEIEPVLLPKIMHWLMQHAPGAQINSVRIHRQTLRSDLNAGRIDLAIDIAHPSEAGIEHQLLLKDEFVLVSQQQKEISPLRANDYITAQHIVVSARPKGRAVEDFSLSRQGIERQIKVRCQQYETACRIVLQSDLLLTMPKNLAYQINAHLNTRISPLPINIEGIELHLYWHKDKASDPQLEWCRQQLLALFQ